MHLKQEQSHLWQSMTAGDQQALEQLYRLHFTALIQYATKLCREREIAEDAIHNVFLYIWQNRASLTGIGSPYPYLVGVLRDECLRLLRDKSHFRHTSELPAPIALTLHPSDLALVENADQNARQRLMKALNNLSPRQREILLLKFFNKLDYQAISDILDINYQSVINHVRRSMLKLREAGVLQYLRNHQNQ